MFLSPNRLFHILFMSSMIHPDGPPTGRFSTYARVDNAHVAGHAPNPLLQLPDGAFFAWPADHFFWFFLALTQPPLCLRSCRPVLDANITIKTKQANIVAATRSTRVHTPSQRAQPTDRQSSPQDIISRQGNNNASCMPINHQKASKLLLLLLNSPAISKLSWPQAVPRTSITKHPNRQTFQPFRGQHLSGI